ncbi:hypothetical protein S245_020308, partial [Arachis hypogaea]
FYCRCSSSRCRSSTLRRSSPHHYSIWFSSCKAIVAASNKDCMIWFYHPYQFT